MSARFLLALFSLVCSCAMAVGQCPINIDYRERLTRSDGSVRFYLRNTTSNEIALFSLKAYWQADGFAPSVYEFSGGPVRGLSQGAVDVPPLGVETQILRSQPFRGIVIESVEFADHHRLTSLAPSCSYFLSPLQNAPSNLKSRVGTLGKPEVIKRSHPILLSEMQTITRVNFDPNGKKSARMQLDFCGDLKKPLEVEGWIIVEYTDSPQRCLDLVSLRFYKSFLDSLPPVEREHCKSIRQNGEPGCGYRQGIVPDGGPPN